MFKTTIQIINQLLVANIHAELSFCRPLYSYFYPLTICWLSTWMRIITITAIFLPKPSAWITSQKHSFCWGVIIKIDTKPCLADVSLPQFILEITVLGEIKGFRMYKHCWITTWIVCIISISRSCLKMPISIHHIVNCIISNYSIWILCPFVILSVYWD